MLDSTSRSPFLASRSLCLAVLLAPLSAQQGDPKPAPLPDPVKGMHEVSPLTPAELARRERPLAGARGGAPGAQRRADFLTTLLFDEPGDGRIWARGATYKASFGTEGFTYVPDFGSEAPRNYPVQFVLRAVRVAGRELAFAPAVVPTRRADRVTFDRGAVGEVYDLGLEQVEQTFLVDAPAGDLEVELEVRSELREDGARDGLQFGNELGLVHYGTAFVVAGTDKREVATTFSGRVISVRVPGSQRGAGPVVIDPIIHTSRFTHSTNRDCHNPDIAYDATFDRYMVVWEHFFSATDTDVFSEFRNGDGTAIAGSLASIDFTTITHAHPRVANINSNDLFLVVMQRMQGAQWQIWGRRRLANSTPQPELFPISDPAVPGHAVFPDVGGDPDEAGPERQWLVVWERQFSASDFDIHARIVRADTSMTPFTIFIENSANTIHSLPHVSQSNGGGFSPTPRWLVVYQFQFSATDNDIYGAVLDRNGAITRASSAIDTSPFDDAVPSVSSPATDFANGDPLFMVTYERQSPMEGRARVLNLNFVNQVTPTGLGQFGLGPFWVRAESDGCRFAVIAGDPIGPTTLAVANGNLVRHDPPTPLPGVPLYARIASKRSGGGVHTDYGIAYVDSAPAPDAIMVAAYRGHVPSGGVTRRAMACGGLGIDSDGRAFLGEALHFDLSNTGADVVGQLLGVPAPGLPLCFGCSLGVDVNGPLINFANLRQLVLRLPCDLFLLGARLAVQGYGAGSGTCLGTFRFSDTLDFTIG